MNIDGAIRDLYAEKAKLERVIAALVEMQRNSGGDIPPLSKSPERRGRKSMGADEREEVSARMKKYWAGRRQTGIDNLETANRNVAARSAASQT